MSYSNTNTSSSPVEWTVSLKLDPPLASDLFSRQAELAARKCRSSKTENKSTQIRRFYDELVLWHEQVKTAPDPEAKFREIEPYLQMLRAKAAYARARKLIDEYFLVLVNALLDGIKGPASLENGKLFFEAFLGFRKFLEMTEGSRK